MAHVSSSSPCFVTPLFEDSSIFRRSGLMHSPDSVEFMMDGSLPSVGSMIEVPAGNGYKIKPTIVESVQFRVNT
jgi:hypothetical protein